MRKVLLSFTLVFVIAAAFFALTSCRDTERLEKTEHTVEGSFDSISIKYNTADVNIFPFEENYVRVLTYDSESLYHRVEIEDGRLVIERVNERKWYDFINTEISLAEVAVYLPVDTYSSLFIEVSTGNVLISEDFRFEDIEVTASTGDVFCYASADESINISVTTGDIEIAALTASDIRASSTTGRVDIAEASCGRLSATVSTGEVRLSEISADENITLEATSGYTQVIDTNTNELTLVSTTGDTLISSVRCESLTADASTGDIILEDVIASDRIAIERNTGDVRIEDSDAKEICINTSTGNVSATLLSGKIFDVNTSSGRKDIPASDRLSDEYCEIETSTGNIIISIKDE